MIDVARDFPSRAKHLVRIDSVLLTHWHRDAVGGLPSLRRRSLELSGSPPIDIFLSEPTA